MRHVLALLCAVRVAFAFSPPLFAWWHEERRRIDSRTRPSTDIPTRAYNRTR